MATYDKSFRPKDLIPNIVYTQGGTELSAEDKETLRDVKQQFSPLKVEELCRACGWNSEHEPTSSYLPRLRVYFTRMNSGLWSMGNDWMVWDRPGEECRNDYMTHQFLQKSTDIPLVKEMIEVKDANGRYNFVIMSRVKGVPLRSIWKGLSRKEKLRFSYQLVVILRKLRQFTAEYPQRVDGSPLWDNIIGQCDSRKQCIKIGKTKEEWLDNMDEELREGLSRVMKTTDKTLVDTRLRELKQNFPDGAPYVLTHADINMGNIPVHEGQIVAIIDWELGGCYSWWVEIYMSYQRAQNDAAEELFDLVWEELWSKH